MSDQTKAEESAGVIARMLDRYVEVGAISNAERIKAQAALDRLYLMALGKSLDALIEEIHTKETP